MHWSIFHANEKTKILSQTLKSTESFNLKYLTLSIHDCIRNKSSQQRFISQHFNSHKMRQSLIWVWVTSQNQREQHKPENKTHMFVLVNNCDAFTKRDGFKKMFLGLKL